MSSEAIPSTLDHATASRRQPPVLTRKHPLVHHVARFFLDPVFRFYFRTRAEGLEQMPREGAFLLAPNHVSMLDWAFISYTLPRLVRFVVHREYYDHPLLGLGLRVNGAVPVRTDRADVRAFRTASAVLASGEPLILFPEGRISLDGRPQGAHPGIITLAAMTGTPIVPIAIRGAFEAFPRWRRIPRPGRVTVVFGSPLRPPPKVADRGEQQQLAARLMERIAALLDGERPSDELW
jgi:1-acyl-sn-glycerol-3-phosphate acyltransferase